MENLTAKLLGKSGIDKKLFEELDWILNEIPKSS